MAHHALVRWNLPFLEWALEQFPESDATRWRLALYYNLNGQIEPAIRRAEELHQRNPENPEAMRLLGRCLIERDAKQALPYLEKVCEQNRSADYLFDLARCQQVVGNSQRSQELHWEILQQNPYMCGSWTNLFILGASRDRLWPYVAPMFERGYGVDEEYFLVAAVLAALELKRPLPVTWFPLAAKRHQMLKTLRGFRDERVRLTRALLAWLAVRPQDANGIEGLPRHFFESLYARFWWPRRAWVPEP
jgi:tetratricopeptide (TPR) repeat protein